MKFFILAFLLVALAYTQTIEADRVEQMPLWPKTSYNLYSGMLNATASGSRKLHYFFVESQRNPATDDLVVWLNGGPGCSSLLGLVQENGPFQFEGVNEYFTDKQETSWNKIANMLYIESPAGVGFSVNGDGKSYTYSDDNTAQDMMFAFNQFIQRFQNKTDAVRQGQKFWISGESYGGMYIPFFADQIVQQNDRGTHPKINIQGFLIGNGAWILNWNLIAQYRENAYPTNHFFNKKYQDLWKNCNEKGNQFDCLKFQVKFNNVANNTDFYNIYNYTYSYLNQGGALAEGEKAIYSQTDLLLNKAFEMTDDINPDLINDFVLQPKGKICRNKQQNKDGQFTASPDQVMYDYFNRDDVKAAMHVPNVEWSMCNDDIYRLYNSAKNSTHLYPEFFNKGLQVLIYSGNTDAAVTFEYTWHCMEDLFNNYGLDMKVSDKWRQWKHSVNHGQVGGMVQTWKAHPTSGSNFHFAMVRAAGHEVPEYQPEAGYYLFEQFLNGQKI